MPKFTIYLTSTATVTQEQTITAKSEDEAREKAREKAKDLGWDIDSVDERDIDISDSEEAD